MSVAVQYYARLKNQLGEQVALFDDFDYLEINEILNDSGSYVVRFLDEDDSRIDALELDGQFEFYRRVLGQQTTARMAWYKEWEAFHRKTRRSSDAEGDTQFESIGVGYNELLARSVVAYKEGTIRAEKNAPAETAMKEYVEENLGLTADDTAVGRLYQGGFPNFTVEGDTAQGAVWVGGRAYDVVLDVLKDIANFASIDYQIVANGDAQFLFKTFVAQMGKDRTTFGVDPSTGLNAYGNTPLVFSREYGSVREAEYMLDRLDEANVVIVMGKGEGSTRTTLTRTDPITIDDSPWNRREVSRADTGYDDDYETYSMSTFGDEVLKEKQAKETFTFKPIQIENLVYGIDYNLGDRVTASYRGILRDKKIVGVHIKYSADSGEEIELDFADIPKR